MMKNQEVIEQFSLMQKEANYFSEQINKGLGRLLELINKGQHKKAEDEAYRVYDFCCGLVDAIEIFNCTENGTSSIMNKEFVND